MLSSTMGDGSMCTFLEVTFYPFILNCLKLILFSMLLYNSACLRDYAERSLVVVVGPLGHRTYMSRPLVCLGRVPLYIQLQRPSTIKLATTMFQTRLTLHISKMLCCHSLRSHKSVGAIAHWTVTLQAPPLSARITLGGIDGPSFTCIHGRCGLCGLYELCVNGLYGLVWLWTLCKCMIMDLYYFGLYGFVWL